MKPSICPSNHNVRFDFLGITNGILAGCVSITAGCDQMEPWAAVCVGFIGSFVYCYGALFMQQFKIDDPLEATAVHGFCGLWGCVAIAFFAKDEGILYGHDDSGMLLVSQILGCVCISVWSGSLSAIFFLVCQHLGVLRMAED